jgi:Ca2+-binding RTX toxin-like protein
MAPWQQDYFAQVVAMAAEQGNAQAKQVLHWESNYIVGRFLQAANGFDPHDGVAYNMVVGTNSGSLYQTWAEIEQATASAGLAANFSGQWAALEYPGYQAWALATLASTITVEQSPDAIQAYGWLAAHAQVNAAWQAASPLYDIVPRLADGNLLTSNNVHILTGTTSQAVAFGNADQLVYDNGTAGNTTITGGSGIDILFAGNGQDLLIGGAGDDFLFGGAGSGADTLSGGGGHNWLAAAPPGTQFNLAAADAAQDIIAGFTPGRDHLHVTGAAGAALTTPQIQSLIAGATAAAGNTTLTLSATHTVTINNLTPAQLSPAAFA